MSRIKSLFKIIKLKIIYNLVKKRSMILKLFPLLSALNWLIQTITGLGEKLDMAVETLTIIFDEFIKALTSSLARLLGNAQ